LAQESATEPSAEQSPAAAPEQAAAPAAGRVGVELRVEVGTLLGLDEHPGEIAGWGAVPAPVARELAETQRHGEWRFAVTDDRGRLLFDGITRHRPDHDATANDPPNGGEGAAGRGAGKDAAGSRGAGGIVELQVPAGLLNDLDLPGRFPAWRRLLADLVRQYRAQRPVEQDPSARFPGRPLRRHSQIRHRTCLFPGCRRPAAQADQDHRHEHARGGLTTADNLAPGSGTTTGSRPPAAGA
jgi:hypothetical protein